MVQRRALGVAVSLCALAGAGLAFRGSAESGEVPVAKPQEAVRQASPAPPAKLSRERLRELSPKVVLMPEGGRMLLAALPDERGVVHAEIPELEEALEVEDADETRRDQLLAETRAAIPEGLHLRSLDVKCGETLCRIKLVKDRKSEAGWGDVDRAIVAFTPGEKIFLTEAEGDLETGFVYFSGEQSVLPLAQVTLPDEDPGT